MFNKFKTFICELLCKFFRGKQPMKKCVSQCCGKCKNKEKTKGEKQCSKLKVKEKTLPKK